MLASPAPLFKFRALATEKSQEAPRRKSYAEAAAEFAAEGIEDEVLQLGIEMVLNPHKKREEAALARKLEELHERITEETTRVQDMAKQDLMSLQDRLEAALAKEVARAKEENNELRAYVQALHDELEGSYSKVTT